MSTSVRIVRDWLIWTGASARWTTGSGLGLGPGLGDDTVS